MGSNSKIMVGTTSRVWRDKDIGLPAPSSGAFLSDLGFQNTWETSRAQPGEAGILTDYLGGKAAETDAKTALDIFTSGLKKMSPKIGASLDPNAVTSWFWAVPIRSRSAAMRAAKSDNIPPCWRRPPCPPCMDDCNLPASKRVAIS